MHLAKECEGESIDDKIRSKYLEIVVQRQLLKEKISSKNQSKKQKISINNYWKNENQFLASSKKEAIDRTIIKAFAMLIKINWETGKYLKTADNLTLGLDSWTNS
ncbi:18606_t:CDS:2 [Dentiscutata erythropus]|uniref:18606_t:CDS:1 n=1 Tax=Dentiscutata erythropus TaxID=1348616 RepID=A0A9N9DK74_9GLOM|nr:18606_t:CDS:2 [Dentiscutata erythropus]